MTNVSLLRFLTRLAVGFGLTAILAGCAVRQIQPETISPPPYGSGGGSTK